MKDSDKSIYQDLPACAAEYIELVVKKIRYRKRVRDDVRQEMVDHFVDALNGCKTDSEKDSHAKELIKNFGDAKTLAKLTRRAKKRCRPLWKKAIIRSLQAFGIIILYLIICGLYLTVGRPNVSVNYVQQLNSQARAGRDESLNCKYLLDEAGELVVKMPKWLSESDAKWPSDFNETELAKFQSWLAENAPALETLKAAMKKPYYWNVYDVNKPNFMDAGFMKSPMNSFSKYRQFAKTLYWQAEYCIYKNDAGGALENSIILYSFGNRMEGQGILIEQLVGIAIEALGSQAIYDTLDKIELTTAQLEKLQHFLEQSQNGTVIDMTAEKFFKYDFIQRNFTDDGHGGGRPLRQGTAFAGKNTKEIIFNMLTFNMPDRKEVITQIDNLYEAYQQSFENPDFKNIKIKQNKAFQNAPYLLQLISPAIGKIAGLSWRLRTDRAGVIAAIAILRYKKDTGQYPESLDELLAKGYIRQIPFDAYKNGPLTYKSDDDGFTLYSFGTDFDDDGGKLGVDRKGKADKWRGEDGDAVFWPVGD